MRLFFTVLLLSSVALIGAQPKPAYTLFKSDGSTTDFGQMIAELKDADVVFYGEYHNNPMSHWLEYEVTAALYKEREGQIVIGAEMFEADNQMIIDEYFQGLITKTKFEEECRLWPNYSTDYAHLVAFAKSKKLRFVATNVPRRYANSVYKQGKEVLDKLSPEAHRFMAPLPIEFKSDTAALMHGAGKGTSALNMAHAQEIKDATMAYFIKKNMEAGKQFIHYNGAFHTNGHSGIIPYLLKLDPQLKIKVIATAVQDDIAVLDEDYYGLGDVIVCTSYDMVTTY